MYERFSSAPAKKCCLLSIEQVSKGKTFVSGINQMVVWVLTDNTEKDRVSTLASPKRLSKFFSFVPGK